MIKILLATSVTVFFLTGSAWSADFSLLLNDDSAQAVLSSAFDKNEFGDSTVGGRLLYNDDKDSLFGSVGVGVSGEPGNLDGLKVGAQVLGNLGRSDRNDLLTFGLGLLASYQPPQLQGLGAYGRVQYSPELLSFLDSERLWEAAVGLNYMFTPKATLLLEYQNVEVDFDALGSQDIDESIRIGIQFFF